MINTKDKLYTISNNKKDIVKLCHDRSFKLIFRKCPNVLARLISDIIGIPYEDIEGKINFSTNELNNTHITIKNKICDYVITIDKLIINIEVNRNDAYWVKYRNLATLYLHYNLSFLLYIFHAFTL